MANNVNCMPQGLVDRADLTNCPTTYSLLASIAIFNAEVALLSLIFANISLLVGHERVRRAVARYSCFPSARWTPFAGVVTAIISIAAMFAATYLLRNNGFRPNAFMLFGFWTMRPRATVFTLLYFIIARVCFGQKGNQNTYLWSLKDHTVEDTLLNMFSLPFALWYILHRPDNLSAGVCSDNTSYLRFWNSFYAIAGAGAISVLLGVVMLGHACSRSRKERANDIMYNMVGYIDADSPLSTFWRFVFTVAGITMVGVFATDWVIWSTFVINAGTDFCPGSVVGEGVAWGVALFANALVRPLIGGPDSS
ncbi:hypothetical protein AYO21_04793 [Fonsecaea monophora]|uniref:Uncharacterized protein n=1 Tax=Fonsecaea monophora TaxID=254056 RepID=A0A177FBC5_9EURO|nr:hypothetical protein AYO21_04793 [Fonsecaea monophora]OAG40951.1 hypothetical protein AYO21_04793 [Fonsecaea monophora]